MKKVVIAFVVGKRGQKEADELLEIVKRRCDENIPFFTSDNLSQYENAILKVYGAKKETESTKKRGRPRKPEIVPLSDLKYAKVKKRREKGKVVEVSTEIVFGDENEIEKIIESSPVSNTINTTLTERNNLTVRERNRRLTRKTLGFSKKRRLLLASLNIYFGCYHFVKVHKGLRIEVNEGRRRWMQRTPMMAVGITDHVWKVEDLVMFRMPYVGCELMEVGH